MKLEDSSTLTSINRKDDQDTSDNFSSTWGSTDTLWKGFSPKQDSLIQTPTKKPISRLNTTKGSSRTDKTSFSNKSKELSSTGNVTPTSVKQNDKPVSFPLNDTVPTLTSTPVSSTPMKSSCQSKGRKESPSDLSESELLVDNKENYTRSKDSVETDKPYEEVLKLSQSTEPSRSTEMMRIEDESPTTLDIDQESKNHNEGDDEPVQTPFEKHVSDIKEVETELEPNVTDQETEVVEKQLSDKLDDTPSCEKDEILVKDDKSVEEHEKPVKQDESPLKIIMNQDKIHLSQDNNETITSPIVPIDNSNEVIHTENQEGFTTKCHDETVKELSLVLKIGFFHCLFSNLINRS